MRGAHKQRKHVLGTKIFHFLSAVQKHNASFINRWRLRRSNPTYIHNNNYKDVRIPVYLRNVKYVQVYTITTQNGVCS